MCNFSEGYFDRGYAKGIKDKELARAEGRAEGILENMLCSIQNLMDSVGFTTEQAMSALKIPDSDKPKYLALLEQGIS